MDSRRAGSWIRPCIKGRFPNTNRSLCSANDHLPSPHTPARLGGEEKRQRRTKELFLKSERNSAEATPFVTSQNYAPLTLREDVNPAGDPNEPAFRLIGNIGRRADRSSLLEQRAATDSGQRRHSKARWR
ncbi:unnamed protein product [Larinioides sclopetarius]|uniref:Uncharacterized protein n=1 Tax=Larinioides sclopetarius TaxID=280406 RepID=A0AAV2BHG7_9ARAC